MSKKDKTPADKAGDEINKLHEERAAFERQQAEAAREFYRKNAQAIENARIRKRNARKEQRRADLNLTVVSHVETPAAAAEAPAAKPDGKKHPAK